MTKSFLGILKNRNFRYIWLSQIFSTVSAATLTFVLIGKIFSSSQSSVAVSLYLFFYYLPTAILGPFVGVFIDHLSKKAILFYSNFYQACMVLFFLSSSHKIWPLYTLAFLYSLGDEFYNPTVGASLPNLVNKEDFTIANSLFFFTSQGSIILGSFIGGLALKLFSNDNSVFLVVCSTLVLASLLVASIPLAILDKGRQNLIKLSRPKELLGIINWSRFWEQAKTGFLFIKNEPMVMFPILLLSGLQVLTGMALILLPSLAKMIRLQYADSSILVILPAVLGAVIGSWFLNNKSRKTRKNVFVSIGLFILGFCFLLFPLVNYVLVKPAILAIFIGVTLGIGYVLIYIPLQTLIQEHTPFKVRGRVFGTLSTLITLMAAIPMLITTTLVDMLGLPLVFILIGLGILAVNFYAQRNKNSLLAIT